MQVAGIYCDHYLVVRGFRTVGAPNGSNAGWTGEGRKILAVAGSGTDVSWGPAMLTYGRGGRSIGESSSSGPHVCSIKPPSGPLINKYFEKDK